MNFLLDEDLAPAAAVIARGRALDVVSVHELDRRQRTDEDQLRSAAGEGRVFLTRNRDDFIRLTVACFQAGEPHPGVLIVPWSLPNRQPERIVSALQTWLDRRGGGPGSMRYVVDFL
jgi:predicted nuclease of predicted toxin-antitoxin system